MQKSGETPPSFNSVRYSELHECGAVILNELELGPQNPIDATLLRRVRGARCSDRCGLPDPY